MTDLTLANVLADALAHHEADSTLESLVLADPIYHAVAGETHLARAWLDYERAGRVAAEALIEITPPAGWTGPTPLFAPRTTTARPPNVGSGAEPATTRHGSAVAGSARPSPPPDSDARDLVTKVLDLAAEIMPDVGARRCWFYDELLRLGRPGDSLNELRELSTVELLGLIERLSSWRTARDRNARRRGVRVPSPGAQR